MPTPSAPSAASGWHTSATRYTSCLYAPISARTARRRARVCTARRWSLSARRSRQELADAIFGELTDEEHDVFRRGRNANVHTIPHSADRAQYQKATALEALFGWLYLQGRHERINELFNRMMEANDAA